MMIKKIHLTYRLNHSQETLIAYLKDSAKDGKLFFKSKYIARDLGMTPKIVGTNMKIIAVVYQGLKIEKWSYSKSTTWYVVPNNKL